MHLCLRCGTSPRSTVLTEALMRSLRSTGCRSMSQVGDPSRSSVKVGQEKAPVQGSSAVSKPPRVVKSQSRESPTTSCGVASERDVGAPKRCSWSSRTPTLHWTPGSASAMPLQRWRGTMVWPVALRPGSGPLSYSRWLDLPRACRVPSPTRSPGASASESPWRELWLQSHKYSS